MNKLNIVYFPIPCDYDNSIILRNYREFVLNFSFCLFTCTKGMDNVNKEHFLFLFYNLDSQK